MGHQRTRVPELVADVEEHSDLISSWPYKLSVLYDEPAVTAALAHIAAEELATVAA
jgi:hypothetical protein